MEDLGYQIKRIDRLFKLRMDRNLEKSGLTNSQMHVLMYLLHHPDQKVTQKCLCQEFEVKHSTMSGILNRMKDKNLIDIKIDEDNKKFKNIYVTKEAYGIKEKLDLYKSKTEEILVKGFSDDEKNKLENFLERLYANLLDDSQLNEEDLKCLHKTIRK